MNKEELIGKKILDIKEGLEGIVLITDNGNYELSQTKYPDGSYDSTSIEKITDEHVKEFCSEA
jgi:hypothetical protein